MSVSNILAPINCYWSYKKANKSQPWLLTDKELSATGSSAERALCALSQALGSPQDLDAAGGPACGAVGYQQPCWLHSLILFLARCGACESVMPDLVKTAFCESRKDEIIRGHGWNPQRCFAAANWDVAWRLAQHFIHALRGKKGSFWVLFLLLNVGTHVWSLHSPGGPLVALVILPDATNKCPKY